MAASRLRRAVRALADYRYRLLAGAVAAAAGGVVLWLAVDLFPYHSSNHDEGVYLQQAAMLLEGRLFLTPGSVALREAVHPWFFVESARGLYPKYSPVPAAVFALGRLAGGYRLALAGVAAANVALVYAVAAAAFDRPTGVLAAVSVAAAPLFLFTSSVFLPYAPTTALNLLFALAYVRSVRRRSPRWGALAGAAAGLAFFARPYTAVLFATPFLVHALWGLWRAARGGDRAALARLGVTAGAGLAFVALTLAYNAAVTGSPLLFPYEAFAPRDGLGFGRREILGHELVYTPQLALESNATVLELLATKWFVAGPVGTALAAVGLALAAADLRTSGVGRGALPERRLRVLLAGVAVTVAAGNVYFWGNYNVLGNPDIAGDGLVSLFGPFYHFDLLPVLGAFCAHGVLAPARRLRDALDRRVGRRGVAVVSVALLAVTLPVVGAAEADALDAPFQRNAAYTEKFEGAYAPFERTDLTGALVFVPPEYGEWRNHPFQWLRNDPGLDGPTVYALARNPDDDFAVADSYPDRQYYRYRYHGEWTPDPTDRVVPVLERLELRSGGELTARTTVGVPERITRVAASVTVGETVRRYDYRGDPPDPLSVSWTLAPGGVAVTGPNFTARGDADPVPIEGPTEVELAVTLVAPSGGTLTYREAALVRPADGGVQALWPPESTVCVLVTRCGLSGTYLPDRPETRPTGIEMNTTLANGGGAEP